MKRATLAIVAMLAVILPIAAASTAGAESSDEEATYTVFFRNITDGQYLTPPNFAAHTRDVDVFQLRQPASTGVQAAAENGGVPILAANLSMAVDDSGFGVSGVGADAPLGPGDSTSFEFTTTGDRLSIVSMLICTNDGFAGLDSLRLPRFDEGHRVVRLRAYDAGTEVNTENRADLVPAPVCGDEGGTGESDPSLAEDGVIRYHRTIRGTGDLPASFDWAGRVAEIVITRSNPTPTYSVTVENITSGQYLTPPNWIAHDDDQSVFTVGQPAGAAVQAVAENGDVPALAAELAAAMDETGNGVSGVGAEAPIAPGATAAFSFSTKEDTFSLVSMLICTNDGFAGIDRAQLPGRSGASKTINVRAFDAGTEINTENRADLVPAPFCGDGGGTGESNPDLAEGWVVTPHRTLRQVGDMGTEFDWVGPVARVTISRN
jgi:hypothetical protein